MAWVWNTAMVSSTFYSNFDLLWTTDIMVNQGIDLENTLIKSVAHPSTTPE